jgi:flagellar biosynthesis protein FlhB
MGKSVGFGEAWMAVLKRSGALLLTMLIASFPMLAGLALCCVGVLVTAIIFFAVLEQIVLLEGIAYFRAISRHVQLVYPNWEWARMLGFYLASYVVVMLAQILLGWAGMVLLLAVEFAREALPLSAQLGVSALGQLWQQLANALVMPYWSVFLTLLYFDLRARREGHDLQVLLARWDELGSGAKKL